MFRLCVMVLCITGLCQRRLFVQKRGRHCSIGRCTRTGKGGVGETGSTKLVPFLLTQIVNARQMVRPRPILNRHTFGRQPLQKMNLLQQFIEPQTGQSRIDPTQRFGIFIGRRQFVKNLKEFVRMALDALV